MRARFGASETTGVTPLGFFCECGVDNSHEQGAMDAILLLHAQLQTENADKQHWQEDIRSFKPAEMAAAIESIDPRCHARTPLHSTTRVSRKLRHAATAQVFHVDTQANCKCR